MFHGHLDYVQKPPLGGRLNTKPGDHGTPYAHNRWFILFYHVWRPTWIEIHRNNIRLRAWSHMASNYTWGGSVTTLHDFGGVLGRPLNTFLVGSHNFMVTALGSCVRLRALQGALSPCKRPLHPTPHCRPPISSHFIKTHESKYHRDGWWFSVKFSIIAVLTRGQWSGRVLGITGWDPSA